MPEPLPGGTIYTETVVHTPPERYAADAPYQLGIIEMSNGGRITARILPASGERRAQVGDPVLFSEWRDGVPYFIPEQTVGE